MALVITTCTNRKRKPVPASLHASSLPQSKLSDLAACWSERLMLAAPRFAASEIYGGRAFQEAAAAAKHMDARLLIVSAGLGLIDASEQVPPYACTVVLGTEDSIAARATENFAPAGWWQQLSQTSPFATSLRNAASGTAGLICAALSEAYIEMVTADFLDLPPGELQRLRIFTRARLTRIAPALHQFVMPYDDRLDGPDSTISGTRSDFAGRALRHFAEHVMHFGQLCSVEDDAAAVAASLEGRRMPERVERTRYDDETMRGLIATHWQAANGSSARLLRLFRDQLSIACEQGRFAELVRDVRASE